ncbi:hypothetical protein ACQKJG_18660 [Priestia megaterium]|uniref:hypothetical protein n=1 Tax=Priestia megaterium TaxID=1404 RepID=UPI003D007B75
MSHLPNEYQPIHQEVWNKLDQLNRRLHFLEKENKELKKENNALKRKKRRGKKKRLKYNRRESGE